MLFLAQAVLTFSAPVVESGARYPAAGRIEAGQGTVAFWWTPTAMPSPDGPIFELVPEQTILPGDVCLRISYGGGMLRFQVRDRSLRDRYGTAPVATDKPHHLALTWSELTGAALYVDGVRRAAVVGPLYLRPRLDGFSFPSGGVNRLRIYAGPLDANGVMELASGGVDPVLPNRNHGPFEKELRGWHAAANIPHGSRFRVRKIEIEDARAINRFWWKLVDGRRDTVWPAPASTAWRYRDEDSDYEISPIAEPFNVVRTTGNAEARLDLGDELTASRPGGQELHYFNFRNPLLIDGVTVHVLNGALAEVACLRVEQPPDLPPPPENSAVRFPVAEETAVGGVRVELETTPGNYYYFAVPDPDDETRRIVEFDARANSSRLTVEIQFTPYVLAAGQTMRLESSSPAATITWLRADLEASRAAHSARRKLEQRDRLQTANESTVPLEPWTEPPPPDGAPRWAWQQVKLVARLKQLADWWIDYRQLTTGEFGNGAEADAALVRLWPAVARLAGNVPRYRYSTRLLFSQNPAGLWPAFELDRGNPRLAEAAMEALRTRASAPSIARLPEISDVEVAQSDMWQKLEQRFEWLTRGEPQWVRFDTSPLEAIRLGVRHDVSWENTGGELAARVEEAREDALRLSLFALSGSARRVRLGVWRLAHGEYDLAVAGEPVRRVTVKPPAFFEIDLPARQIVPVEFRLRERRTPTKELPDLAIGELTVDERGLAVPVHNLAKAGAGAFRVTVRSSDGESLAETRFAGLEAPADGRPRIVLARFAEIGQRPGLQVEVRLESGEEALDSNNAATVK